MSEVKIYGVAKSALWDSLDNPACFSSETLVVLKPDFDAQRLRADTAEATVAERDEALTLVNRDLIEAQTAVTGWARKHAAAEQRIAELKGALENLLDAYSKPDSRICCSGHDCGCMGASNHQLAEHYAKEALNPKPEAGSHE